MHVAFRNLKSNATIAACRQRLDVERIMAGKLLWQVINLWIGKEQELPADSHNRHPGKGQHKLQYYSCLPQLVKSINCEQEYTPNTWRSTTSRRQRNSRRKVLFLRMRKGESKCICDLWFRAFGGKVGTNQTRGQYWLIPTTSNAGNLTKVMTMSPWRTCMRLTPRS